MFIANELSGVFKMIITNILIEFKTECQILDFFSAGFTLHRFITPLFKISVAGKIAVLGKKIYLLN